MNTTIEQRYDSSGGQAKVCKCHLLFAAGEPFLDDSFTGAGDRLGLRLTLRTRLGERLGLRLRSRLPLATN